MDKRIQKMCIGEGGCQTGKGCKKVKNPIVGNSLVIPWLELCAFQCQGPGFSPWLGNYDPASCVAQPKKKKSRCKISKS